MKRTSIVDHHISDVEGRDLQGDTIFKKPNTNQNFFILFNFQQTSLFLPGSTKRMLWQIFITEIWNIRIVLKSEFFNSVNFVS